MRLKLIAKTPIEDPAEKGWRLLERGELTLGRSADCGWPLADPDRTLSKVHCRIVRQGAGFVLRDESVNGVTVDGVELVEGQAAPLSNGSSVRLGPFGFAVEITGEEEPDWSDPDPALTMGDEDLTVTSIIADVSPGGRSAAGIIPGRSGDEWIEAQGARDPERTPGAPQLRDAEIGWSGPPDLKLVQAALPDDWNLASETSSRTEHLPATTSRVRLARAADPTPETEAPAPPPQSHDAADALVAAFLAGARLPPAVPSDPAQFLREMGKALRAAAERVAALEAASADFLADHGVDRSPSPIADPSALAERLDRLIDDQRALQGAVGAVLDDFAQRFDPRAIEARADAKAASGGITARLRSVPVLAERSYWAAFRDAYRAGDGASGLEARFREALGGTKPPRAKDDFEELGSDVSRGGAQ